MKTYKKEIQLLKEKNKIQMMNYSNMSKGYLDLRKPKPILFGKDAVDYLRKNYGKIIPMIYTIRNGRWFHIECFTLVSGCEKNSGLITRNVVFHMTSGDSLVWPPKYSDESKRIFPLLGIEQ